MQVLKNKRKVNLMIKEIKEILIIYYIHYKKRYNKKNEVKQRIRKKPLENKETIYKMFETINKIL